MASISPSISIEEEIGAFMIAISATLLLRINDDTETVPKICSSGISSAAKSQALLWQESVSETEMTCNEIAYKVNNLRRENELDTLFVNGLALEHGISCFVYKLREKRRGTISKPSELGFQWSFRHNRY